MERNERACKGERTLDDYDMIECLACGFRVAHDFVDHPFFGFKAGCPMDRVVFREEPFQTMHKVEIGNATLYLGDCRDVIPTIAKVDAVVTDPPYEIGEAWHGDFSGKNGRAAMWGSQPSWDVMCQGGLDISLAKAADAIVWGGHLYNLPRRSRWLSWDKIQKFSSGDFELAWTNRDGATRTFRMSRIDAYQNSGDGKQHPTQKPVALMEWCLTFLPDSMTILDPFMGSGTTGVACINLSRKFIGIEIEPKYFEIACERIRSAQAQQRLFA